MAEGNYRNFIKGEKNTEFQKPPFDGVVQCKLLSYTNVVTKVIRCARSNQRDTKMRWANLNHTRFQVKKDYVDSPGTCFTGEIVLPKWRLCYQRFVEISIFENIHFVVKD
ncbi:hypothetical protein TNCV_1980541 [Trichonephila clavipes]|nr:hypothetical protein TNCV_1980541 [Trichonephila clavipes]